MIDSSGIHLVIARFKEDLRWVRRVPAAIRVTVYNKGDEDPEAALPKSLHGRPGLEVISLPNVGREAHTYLTHLAGQYGSLARMTVFCQGHPFDHAPDLHGRLGLLLDSLGSGGPDPTPPFIWFGFLEDTDDRNGRRLFVSWSKNPERRELSTGRLHEELFGEPGPELFHFRGGAQFAVTREAVHRRPRAFYERALELSQNLPLAAHSYERLWDRVFGEPVIDPATLGPSGVRYLKRIRRLEGPREASQSRDCD